MIEIKTVEEQQNNIKKLLEDEEKPNVNKDYDYLEKVFIEKKEIIYDILNNSNVDRSKYNYCSIFNELEGKISSLKNKNPKILSHNSIIYVPKNMALVAELTEKRSKLNIYSKISDIYEKEMQNFGASKTVDSDNNLVNDLRKKLDKYINRLKFPQLINSHDFISGFKNNYEASMSHIAARNDTIFELPPYNFI